MKKRILITTESVKKTDPDLLREIILTLLGVGIVAMFAALGIYCAVYQTFFV